MYSHVSAMSAMSLLVAMVYGFSQSACFVGGQWLRVVTEMYKSAEEVAGLLQHLCQTDRSFMRCKKQCGNHMHCCL